MRVAGSNVLSIAMRVLNSQTVDYFRYEKRESNQIGLYVTTYIHPVKIKGNLQPVPRSVYDKLGLDFQKSYWRFWAKIDFLDIQRDVSGDNIEANRRRYQCLSATPWFSIDGWTEILLVDVGPELKKAGFGSRFGKFGG